MYHHVKGLLLVSDVKQRDLYMNTEDRDWKSEATGFRWESVQDKI